MSFWLDSCVHINARHLAYPTACIPHGLHNACIILLDEGVASEDLHPQRCVQEATLSLFVLQQPMIQM